MTTNRKMPPFIFQILEGKTGHRTQLITSTSSAIVDDLQASGIYDRDTEETPFYIIMVAPSQSTEQSDLDFFSRFPVMRITNFCNFILDEENTNV